MKLASLTFTLLLISILNMNAQGLGDKQHFGTVTDMEGNNRVGVIQLWSDMGSNLNQEKIWFFETDTTSFNTKIKKGKMEKFKAKDLKSYSVGGSDFDQIQFNPSESLSNQLLSGKTYIWAKVVQDGSKLKVYSVIPKAPSTQVISGGTTSGSSQEDINDDTFLVYSRENEKAKEFGVFTISAYFEDCPSLVKEYEAGMFILKPKGKGIKGFLDQESLTSSEHDQAAMEIASAYNKQCGE